MTSTDVTPACTPQNAHTVESPVAPGVRADLLACFADVACGAVFISRRTFRQQRKARPEAYPHLPPDGPSDALLDAALAARVLVCHLRKREWLGPA